MRGTYAAFAAHGVKADWGRDWGPTRRRRAARSGSLPTMNTTDNIHPSALDVSAEVVEVTGAGLRVVEIGAVVLLGLLVTPPLLILAVVVAMPAIAVGAVVAAIAVPTMLVRRVRAHHRAHGSTLFLHRLMP
jgi:hypothetical protein